MSTFYLILISLFSGVLFSTLLYYKNSNWKKPLVYLLFTLRCIAIALLTFLLFAPLFKNSTTEEIKPTVAIIVDNSLSNTPKNGTRSQSIKKLQEFLESKNIASSLYDFSNTQSIDSIKYNHPISNLKNLFDEVIDKTSLNNIASYVFISDGIENSGNNIDQLKITTPIITVGCGDTAIKKDLIAQHVTYNRSIFKGNLFKVAFFFNANEFNNKNATILFKEKNKVLHQQNVTLQSSNEFKRIEFEHQEESIGSHTYEIEIVKLDGEYSYKNNKLYATVTIYENKQKILIVANSPHPDIKALANALDNKENIEYKVQLPYLPLPSKDVDLIIFHQIPDNKSTAYNELLINNIPKLFLIGNNTNFNAFNQAQSILKIMPKSNAKDIAYPYVNNGFTNFLITPEEQEGIAQYPPLAVTYGEYKISAEAQSIFNQKIGSTETDKPILVVANDHKTGVAISDGWWMWRNYEQLKFNNTTVFDSWVNKLIQYLALQPNHKKFDVKPAQHLYSQNAAIVFETEIYDDLLNRSFNHEVKLDLFYNNKKIKSYSYINTSEDQEFSIPGFQQSGTYEYIAKCDLNKKTEVSKGSFIVSEESIEYLNTKADWNKLKVVAEQNNGFFVEEKNMLELTNKINTSSYKSLLRTTDTYTEIIDFWWLLLIAIALLTTEWLIRKRHLHI